MDGLRENDKTDQLTTFGSLRNPTCSCQKQLGIRRYMFSPRYGRSSHGEDGHTAGTAAPDTSIPTGSQTETAAASAKNLSIVNSPICARCKERTWMLSKQLVNTIASANIEMWVLSEVGANLLRQTTKCNVCLKSDMFGGNSEARYKSYTDEKLPVNCNIAERS